MKKLLILFFASIATTVFGQINKEESSAQVVAYWSRGETQSYSVSHQKIKLEDADTTQNLIIVYDIDVTVTEEKKDSYTVEWYYHNFRSNATNEVRQGFIALPEGMKVAIETNELGVTKGVKNWRDVSKYMMKAIQDLRNDFKNHPDLQADFKLMEAIYTTKQGLEASGIDDAQQYYTFHGGKYFRGKDSQGKAQAPNPFDPNKPLDTTITTSLVEIDAEDKNFIVRMNQTIDSIQLTEATLNYLKSVVGSTGSQASTTAEIGKATSGMTISSLIHETGWVIYSTMEKIVENHEGKLIEKRIIST